MRNVTYKTTGYGPHLQKIFDSFSEAWNYCYDCLQTDPQMSSMRIQKNSGVKDVFMGTVARYAATWTVLPDGDIR
jgi:hypothetical protein